MLLTRINSKLRLKSSIYFAWALIVGVVFCDVSTATEPAASYVIKKGKNYPVCQEILPILNAPENEDLRLRKGEHISIFLPQENAQFRPIIWEKIPQEEWSKMLYSEKITGIMNYQKEWTKKEDRGNGKWNGTGDWIVEKATVNLNWYWKDATLLRLSLPGWHSGFCISPENAPENIKILNKLIDKYGGSAWGDRCEGVYFQNQFFLVNRNIVFEPYTPKPIPKQPWEPITGLTDVCTFLWKKR